MSITVGTGIIIGCCCIALFLALDFIIQLHKKRVYKPMSDEDLLADLNDTENQENIYRIREKLDVVTYVFFGFILGVFSTILVGIFIHLG